MSCIFGTFALVAQVKGLKDLFVLAGLPPATEHTGYEYDRNDVIVLSFSLYLLHIFLVL